MSRLASMVSHRRSQPDVFLDNPPFPLVGAALGLIVVVNVASTIAMLVSA
jgi:hypothetical protein